MNATTRLSVEDIVLVSQLPSQSWFEGFAMRPNGHLLTTRIDEPELYTLDAGDPNATPRLLHTFPDANGLLNLCPLPGASAAEEYIVLAGVLDTTKGLLDKPALWRVTLGGGGDAAAAPAAAVKTSKILDLDGVGLSLAIAPVSDNVVLIADSLKACIWKTDLTTGHTSLLIRSDTMAPARSDDYFGVNRLRIVDDAIWFTNSSKGILARIPFSVDGSGSSSDAVRATGPVRVVVDDLGRCDGLAVAADGTVAYTANFSNGQLWRVDVDRETGRGTTVTVMDNLINPTAVELVAGDGRRRLFIICGGEIEMAWMSDQDRSSWSALADLESKMSVSVTTTTTTEEITL